MPGHVTIVGLGPGDASQRTAGAQAALDRADRIILRTAIHPGTGDLLADRRVTSCDDLYESLHSFDEVYESIADRVVSLAAAGDVVFAVPGHPLFGERATMLIRRKAETAEIPVTLLSAVSALDAISTRLGIDLLDAQVQLLDATALQSAVEREPFAGGAIEISTARPVLVTQVYSASMASAVKLALSRFFPEDHRVTIVSAAGVPGIDTVTECALHELDHHRVDHLSSVWVPALEVLQALRTSGTLHRIIAALRAPGGCPWDRKQTHQSLRNAVIDESYEVADAIDQAGPENLAEELGDLLLIVALHTQIAEEAGAFTIEDVYDQVNRKLIRRHPHVFGDVTAETPADVVRTWQSVKQIEREARGDSGAPSTPYDALPKSMPALTKITRLLERTPEMIAPGDSADPADAMLQAVARLIAAGLDPETELERVVRDRSHQLTAST